MRRNIERFHIEFILEIILITINKQIKESNQESNQESNRKILSLMKKNSRITIKDLCKKTNLSESGVKKIIKKLKDKNVLKRYGANKNGCWKVIDK